MNPTAATMPNAKQSTVTTGAAPQLGTGWLSEPLAEAPCSAVPGTAATATMSGDEALRRSQSELRLLSAALMSMQEMERKRIATDLHDSIGQSLSALSCGIGAALDGARRGDATLAVVMLEKLAAQVKETIVEVQRVAMDLRPAMLDDIGLLGTLSWFFREFRAVHPGLALNNDIDIEERDVLPALRTHIFRVMQEATSNVVKHASAREIWIRLRRANREVHLEVADNGVGFAAEKAGRAAGCEARCGAACGGGMGLTGMRDRAEFSGGRFCVVSAPGKGTRVFVAWPLKPD